MIREANISDLESINNLLKEFNYKLNSLNEEFLNVLVHEDNIIDAVLVYKYIYDRIEIDYIVVSKEKRRCGLATSLIKYLDKYNCSITLEVSEENKSAVNLYKKCGFKEAAIRKNYYKDSNGILMMKSGD